MAKKGQYIRRPRPFAIAMKCQKFTNETRRNLATDKLLCAGRPTLT